MKNALDETLAAAYRDDPESDAGRAAARELFERYRERVYLWCARRVRNREEALDLAQDVLVSAFRALGSFEGRSRYSTWIFTIARNRCHRAMRAPSLVRDDEIEVDDTAAPGADPVERFAREQDEERLLSLMNQVLEPHERQALWWRCIERLTVDEVTRRLGITGSSGARSVLQSARKKLRAALERRRMEEA
ncbi:MAG: sigma-70 family RNA polymerase sigma factor [Candidatus Eisenbacteria bacterium]|nr:sigma-70 family RNA polymerase sigma factor [Candidatus Eisenbacteria bacterium]